jgi:transposase
VPSSPVCTCASCPTHDRDRGQIASTAHRLYPGSSITDAQWAVLAPLLPPPGNTAGRGGRPEKHPRRLVLDAIFYLVRGGIAWAALPREFPPHQTVYGIFTRWTRHGVWQRIHDALRDQVRVHDRRHPLPTAAIIDSQSVRGADTVPRHSRGFDGGKKINGRKRHIAVDTGGLLLAVVVTIAAIQDRDAAFRLLTQLRSRFSTIALVWADGGYSGRLVTGARQILGLIVEAVPRGGKPAGHGFTVLTRRWVVERTFAWISKHRRCVRDYETLPTHHEAMIHIAMTMIMSRRLARTRDR